MITEYLLKLLERLPRTPSRRRIVREVEDHLLASAAELHAGGLDAVSAEREAVRRFGDPGAVAAEFVRVEVDRAARTAGRRALVLALVVAECGMHLASGSGPWLPHLAAFVLAQVAVVVGGLTYARGWTAMALLVWRGVAVVVLCAMGLAACAAAGNIATPQAWPAPAWILLTASLAAAVACVHALVELRRLGRSASIATAPDIGAHDALADVQALLALASVRWSRLRPADVTVLAAARRRPRLMRWLDLRHHPWRFALLVSLGVGLMLAAAHGVAEGPPPPGAILRGVAAGAIITAIEAVAALSGFALLGRYLCIRRAGGSQPSSVR